MPTIGRFRTSSIRLATYMLAIRPQNRLGLEVISSGPGEMPWIMNPPSNIAAEEEKGSPSDRSGIICAEHALLLADSGPATPSIAPFPHSSGCLLILFSTE